MAVQVPMDERWLPLAQSIGKSMKAFTVAYNFRRSERRFMSSDSAALLTKTQRQRIQNRFAELDRDKTRRDQQRIRQRIAAGTEDFSLLVNYPDEQFRMAFDDYSDEELLDALADSNLVLERIRENRGIDREHVVRRTRERALNDVEETADVATLDRLDFETASERRRRLIEELQSQLGPNLWGHRANRLLRFAGCALLPVFLMGISDKILGTSLLDTYNDLFGLLLVAGLITISVVLAIKLLQMVKYDIIPAIHTLADEPETVFATLYDWFVANPGRTLHRSWDKL